MTFVFGRGGVFNEEVKDETNAGGGGAGHDGGTTAPDAGGDDVVDEPAPGEGGAAAKPGAKKEGGEGETKVAEPKDMKAAIDVALGYDKDAKAAAEKKAVEDNAATELKAKVEAGGKHANGTPKLNDKGEAQDEAGKPLKAPAAAKLKTAAELDLKPEQKKLLAADTRIRFGELINTLKTHEGTLAKQTETITRLSGARDAILGALDDSRTSQEQLAQYLEFNTLVTSNNPKDWEQALAQIEQQRAALYKALGREPAGGEIDLLKDFPDLSKQVEDEEITRAAALEIAKGRRERAAAEAGRKRQESQQNQQTRTAEQFKTDSDTALKDIFAWTAEIAKSDIDYKAKEDKLLGETLDGVLKDYPPRLWLPTLKRLYAGLTVQKAPAVGNGKQERPIRPSGAKPGAKAPATMLEAINAGLGYAGAEKG